MIEKPEVKEKILRETRMLIFLTVYLVLFLNSLTILFKATLFSCFVFLFDLLEHIVIGFFKGERADIVWKEFANHGLNTNLGKLAITFLFFILFFSLLEIARVIGEQKFFRLFTHGSSKSSLD